MASLLVETWKLRAFAWARIPLIAWVRPSVVALDDTRAVVRIPHGRRTRNHLGSMYFGALAIGADLAGGLVAMREIDRLRRAGGPSVSLVFKDVRGEFLRRAEEDVHFTCADGAAVRDLVAEAAASGERVERTVRIEATVRGEGEPVARFDLTLSLKRRG